MTKTYHLTVRITEHHERRLADMAKQFNVRTSEIVRQLIENATIVHAPTPGAVLNAANTEEAQTCN